MLSISHIINKQVIRVVILFSFLCSGINYSNAQDDSYNELWGAISMRKYNSKFKFWLRNDLGLRYSNNEYPSTMLLARPRIIFNLGNYLSIQPGIDFRYSHSKENSNVMEIRTWQGLTLDWPQIKRVMFDHIYRFEQRIYFIEGKRDDNVSLRSRYRLRMRIPLNKKAITDNTYYIDLQGEAFFQHDDNIDELFANTLRVGLNIGYNHTQKWRYYLTSFVDRGRNNYDDNLTADRFILSFTIRRTMF